MRHDEFIRLYNELLNHLKEIYHLNDKASMSRALNAAHRDTNNNPVKNNWEALDVIRRLRNLIEHERTLELKEIAEPSEELVAILRRVVYQYEHPTTIEQYLEERAGTPLISFHVSDALMSILDRISNDKFSQFPVFDDSSFVGMISDNGITNWLAAYLSKEGRHIKDIHEVTIADMIKHEENQDRTRMISKHKDLFSLVTEFEAPEVTTVLVCHNKHHLIKKPEDLVGILTTFDLKEIYKEVL